MEFGKQTAGLSVGRIDAFLWPRSIQNLRKNGEKGGLNTTVCCCYLIVIGS